MFTVLSLQGMLLTSHGDCIRVFPALPGLWMYACFADFRAEGAFPVSAEWRGGVTRAVRVASRAGEPCRIRTTLPGPIRAKGTRNFALKELPDGVTEVDVRQGEGILLYSGDTAPDFQPAPVELGGQSGCSGLRKPSK